MVCGEDLHALLFPSDNLDAARDARQRTITDPREFVMLARLHEYNRFLPFVAKWDDTRVKDDIEASLFAGTEHLVRLSISAVYAAGANRVWIHASKAEDYMADEAVRASTRLPSSLVWPKLPWISARVLSAVAIGDQTVWVDSGTNGFPAHGQFTVLLGRFSVTVVKASRAGPSMQWQRLQLASVCEHELGRTTSLATAMPLGALTISVHTRGFFSTGLDAEPRVPILVHAGESAMLAYVLGISADGRTAALSEPSSLSFAEGARVDISNPGLSPSFPMASLVLHLVAESVDRYAASERYKGHPSEPHASAALDVDLALFLIPNSTDNATQPICPDNVDGAWDAVQPTFSEEDFNTWRVYQSKRNHVENCRTVFLSREECSRFWPTSLSEKVNSSVNGTKPTSL
jgi:hypothetical protein